MTGIQKTEHSVKLCGFFVTLRIYLLYNVTCLSSLDESRSKRERKHSGSDLSDSTAVLTTAHPGYHSDKDTFQKSSQKETDSSHRFLDGKHVSLYHGYVCKNFDKL